ncbi:MAG: DMT family transporter [Propionibacteriaceae bacterium]
MVVAVLWGVTFTVTAEALAVLPPAYVVVLRFGLAALLLTMVTRGAPALPDGLRSRAVVLGSLLGGGFLLQTWALQRTDAAMSGFLTGLLVVIAPVLDTVLFGRHARTVTWAAVGLALLGLAVLSIRTAGFGLGDLLTVGAAALWALHLVLLSRWSVPDYAISLARTQTTTVAVLALTTVGVELAWHPAPAPLPMPLRAWLLVAFLAVLSTAVPVVLLTWAQSRVDASRTAVLLTLEPAVAAMTAAFAGVTLDPRTVLGGLILVAAMGLVALGPEQPALPAEVR